MVIDFTIRIWSIIPWCEFDKSLLTTTAHSSPALDSYIGKLMCVTVNNLFLWLASWACQMSKMAPVCQDKQSFGWKSHITISLATFCDIELKLALIKIIWLCSVVLIKTSPLCGSPPPITPIRSLVVLISKLSIKWQAIQLAVHYIVSPLKEIVCITIN